MNMFSNKRRARAGLAVVLFAALFGAAALSPLRADTWRGLELKQRIEGAAWRLGPLRIAPSLVVRNAGFDSNVLNSPDNPIRDFTVTAGPAATVFVPVLPRFILSLTGSPQYLWFNKTKRERAWNFYFTGAAQLNLRNIFFSLDGEYSDARERWNTEIDIRPRRKGLGYGSSVLVALGYRTSFGVGYRTVKYDYESLEIEGFDVRERLNRRESYGNVSIFYQLGTARRAYINFEYGDYKFEFAERAALQNSRSYGLYGGLEFIQPGRRLQGHVRLGYKKFDVLAQEGLDFRGFVGDTALRFRVARPLVLRASYIRDVVFSLWFGNPFFVESRPGVGVSLYTPLSFIRLDYDFALGRNRYFVPGGGEPGVTRLDDYTMHTAGIYFRIRRDTALGFITSWWARNSNLPGEDDKRTFFGLNLTYEF